MGYKKTYLNPCGLYDRVKKLLVSYEWSDCNFEVAGKSFKAHRLILGISSPVFEAMFYGPLSSSDKITITDMEADTFQLLLNYIYTDDVEIESIEQAYELLYASKKYMLEQLSELSKDYIKNNISMDNVVTILNYPEYMQDEQLKSIALRLFCEHARYLFEENKCYMTIACMKAILEKSCINITEKELIKHVLEWTKDICDEENIPCTPENRWSILKNHGILKLLRFSSLSANDVEETLCYINKLLLSTEAEDVMNIIKNSKVTNNGIVPFSLIQSPRKSLKLSWCLCHRASLRSAAPVTIDYNNFKVHTRLKVNKTVFINSLCIPSRMGPILPVISNATKHYAEQISVSIICESDNSVMTYTNFANTVEYDSTVDIELSEPCVIKKDKWYKISFTWPRNRFNTYSYVVEHRDRFYKDHRVMFEFEDIGRSNQIGSFLGGLKFIL